MPLFVNSSVNETHRDYVGLHINNPVNIELCTELVKKNEPNGYGKEYPVIIFKGCNAVWYYHEIHTKVRDNDYQKLLERFSK